MNGNNIFNDSLTARKRYMVFFAGLLLIIIVSGSWRLNPDIFDKSVGYFVHKNIEQANEAGKLGHIKYESNDYAEHFGIDWQWKPGVRRIIRSGPDDFDDIGYLTMLQLAAMSGVQITIEFLGKLHNYAFIIALAILSYLVARMCSSMAAGWIFMMLSLTVKSCILSIVYGSPDSRTFVVFFPIIIIAIILQINRMGDSIKEPRGMIFALFAGLLAGFMTSVRFPEGVMPMTAIALSILLLKIGLRRKIAVIGALLIGFYAITFLMPIVLSMHRDIKTGIFDGKLGSYLQGTGRHQSLQSLVGGLGRYENSYGLKPDDIAVYDVLRKQYPTAMDEKLNVHGKDYYKGLKSVYLSYIREHPFEYIRTIISGYVELFYFVPYSTSAGNGKWHYGYMPIKDGVEIKDPYDMVYRRMGLYNLRLGYMRLSLLGWIAYLLTVAAMAYAVKLYLGGNLNDTERNIFISCGFYLFFQATVRALIPYHGLSFIVNYWMLSFFALLYIGFNDRLRFKFELDAKRLLFGVRLMQYEIAGWRALMRLD